jgi:hypothetical protein
MLLPTLFFLLVLAPTRTILPTGWGSFDAATDLANAADQQCMLLLVDELSQKKVWTGRWV